MVLGIFVTSHKATVLEQRVGVGVFLDLFLLQSPPSHLTLTGLFPLTTKVPGFCPLNLLVELSIFITQDWLLLFQLHFCDNEIFNTGLRAVQLALPGLPE